jgi:hypothetical protein
MAEVALITVANQCVGYRVRFLDKAMGVSPDESPQSESRGPVYRDLLETSRTISSGCHSTVSEPDDAASASATAQGW